jgi:hypothetical protein
MIEWNRPIRTTALLAIHMTVSDASYISQRPPPDHKWDYAISSEKSEDGLSSRPSRRTVWEQTGNKKGTKTGFQCCWEFNSSVYEACVQRRDPSWAQGVQQADAQFGHSTRRKKSFVYIRFLSHCWTKVPPTPLMSRVSTFPLQPRSLPMWFSHFLRPKERHSWTPVYIGRRCVWLGKDVVP